MKRNIIIGVLAVAVAAAMLPMGAFAAVTGIDPLALLAGMMDPSALLSGLGLAGFAMVGDIQLIRSKQLREQRAILVEDNGKLLSKIEAEKDAARVKELEAEWDKRDADIVALTRQIERAERQEANERDMGEPLNERRSGRLQPTGQQENPEERQKAYRSALFSYLRGGHDNMEPEARAILRSGFRTEQRDGMSTTNANGGYTIPTDLFRELQNSLLHFGGARQLATILTTNGGNPITVPTVDDTGNKAQIVGEGSSLTSPQEATWGTVTLNSFMYRSFLPITLELMQDSAFDLEAWIMAQMSTRVARGTNVHFTTGNGTTQPKGFIPASSSGVTAASATAVSYNDLIDLEHSVDPAYRQGPQVGFQFKDSTLKLVKKLVDGQSRPLWLPGLAVREPDTILGYKYVINQDMAAVQASNKSVAFGDWSKFWIRDVNQMLIVRANEKHIDQGMIGFYCFSRHDSDLMDAGTDPIKHLTHPSPD